MERQLIHDYEKLIADLIANTNAGNYDVAIDLASVPEHIRGFGHVKHAHYVDAKKRWDELLVKFKQPAFGAKEIRIREAA